MFNIDGNAIEFVRLWPQLGNSINNICDDKDDILKKLSTMCGQINNVLCFFGKVDAVIKTQLLTIFCSSLYDSVVWNLNHVCIAEVCELGVRASGESGVSLLILIVNFYR